jgi:hypothetical protein
MAPSIYPISRYQTSHASTLQGIPAILDAQVTRMLMEKNIQPPTWSCAKAQLVHQSLKTHYGGQG